MKNEAKLLSLTEHKESYTVKRHTQEHGWCIHLYRQDKSTAMSAALISTTKRGWTFMTYTICSNPVKLFFSRSEYKWEGER